MSQVKLLLASFAMPEIVPTPWASHVNSSNAFDLHYGCASSYRRNRGKKTFHVHMTEYLLPFHERIVSEGQCCTQK